MTVTSCTQTLPSACTQTTRQRREAFGQGRQTYSCRKLRQHEAARHPRRRRRAKVAKDGGGQQQVPERVPEHVVLTGQQAVDGEHAGDRRHDVVERHIQPARSLDPTEPGVEQQQADQPQPEHRHGIAEQGRSGSPGPASGRDGLPPARPSARRHHADDKASIASSSVAGNTCSRSCSTGREVMTELPKSPCTTFTR